VCGVSINLNAFPPCDCSNSTAPCGVLAPLASASSSSLKQEEQPQAKDEDTTQHVEQEAVKSQVQEGSICAGAKDSSTEHTDEPLSCHHPHLCQTLTREQVEYYVTKRRDLQIRIDCLSKMCSSLDCAEARIVAGDERKFLHQKQQDMREMLCRAQTCFWREEGASLSELVFFSSDIDTLMTKVNADVQRFYAVKSK